MPNLNSDYLDNPALRYPEDARERGEEGKVLINTDGSVAEITMRKSSGYASLDQSALATVKKWRFVPARRGAATVSAWVVVPVTFFSGRIIMNTTDVPQSFPLQHFLAQSDGVGQALFAILIMMPIACWYCIILKAWRVFRIHRRSAQFLKAFWESASLEQIAERLDLEAPEVPFSLLARYAIRSGRHHARHGGERLHDAGSASEFLTRAMRRVIDEETARMERGLTLLASIASTAPFVGLFGTFWGAFHALTAIGRGGTAS